MNDISHSTSLHFNSDSVKYLNFLPSYFFPMTSCSILALTPVSLHLSNFKHPPPFLLSHFFSLHPLAGLSLLYSVYWFCYKRCPGCDRLAQTDKGRLHQPALNTGATSSIITPSHKRRRERETEGERRRACREYWQIARSKEKKGKQGVRVISRLCFVFV